MTLRTVRLHTVSAGLLAILSLPALSPLLAAAADPDPATAGETLSLADCADLALGHAFSVRIADEKVLTAEEKKGQAVLGFLPEVTSGVTWSGRYFVLNPDYFASQSAVESVSRPDNEWTDSSYAWARVQEPLLDAGRWLDYSEAREGIEREKVDRRRAEKEVLRSVAEAFYTLVKARRSVSVAVADLERKRETLEMVEASVAVGKKPRYEILRAEVDVGESRQVRIVKENEERIARAGLSKLLGVPVGEGVRFREPAPGANPGGEGLDRLVERAFAERPELRVREHDEQIQKLALHKARWDWAPDLSLSASYERYLGLGPLDIYEESWGVGLTLSIPLIDSFANEKRVATARHGLRRHRLELEEAKQEIAFQVERAYLDRQAAREALGVSETQVALARENYESARERYTLEVSSFFELSEAETDLAKAELEQVKAFYDLRLAESELAYQTGGSIRLE